MKTRTYSAGVFFPFLLVLFFYNQPAEAQHMSHGASQRYLGGGGQRPAGARQNMGGAGGTQRSHGDEGRNNRSINGGAVKSPERTIRNTSSTDKNLSGGTNKTANINRNPDNKRSNDHTKVNARGNTRNSNNTNISGNTVNVNVDRSKDINVVNNRNTVVRHNNIATYHRPPYVYGGRRYYSYHPYHYHPYRPYVWGPVWHPWGFFVAALATTAIIVAVADATYHYDQGVWYSQSGNGYTVVQAPVGGTVTTIPTNNQPVVVNNVTNYYYGGAYYEKTSSGYKVVAPPAGAVVDNLPEGGEEVKIGDQTYVKVGETYYQPVNVDGKNKYEVAQVEQGQ